jgi:hypothetical protein
MASLNFGKHSFWVMDRKLHRCPQHSPAASQYDVWHFKARCLPICTSHVTVVLLILEKIVVLHCYEGKKTENCHTLRESIHRFCGRPGPCYANYSLPVTRIVTQTQGCQLGTEQGTLLQLMRPQLPVHIYRITKSQDRIIYI